MVDSARIVSALFLTFQVQLISKATVFKTSCYQDRIVLELDASNDDKYHRCTGVLSVYVGSDLYR